MLKRISVLVGILIFTVGCYSSYSGEYYGGDIRVEVSRGDTSSVPLDSTYVEAFADPDFTVLVKRSTVEYVYPDGLVAVIQNFWLPDGTYYVRAWKDADGDGTVSSGDLYGIFCGEGVYECPEPAPLSVEMEGYYYRDIRVDITVKRIVTRRR